MSILMSADIKKTIFHELDSASKSVQIITAFCKKGAIQILDSHIAPSVESKRLLVRFRLDDLINGSTDFSILQYGKDHGWDIFIRFDLHAKTYIVDDKRGILGSANTTNNGLIAGNSGNLEIATVIDLNNHDLQKISNLFEEAILVDDNIFRKLKAKYESVNICGSNQYLTWDEEITSLFSPNVTALFSYDFPECADITHESVTAFLGLPLDASFEQIKKTFLLCRGYRWIVQTTKDNGNCIYFGELTQKLHAAIIEDPKPYRREVKELLANILSWINIMNPEDITVDQPRHSQRIRYLK